MPRTVYIILNLRYSLPICALIIDVNKRSSRTPSISTSGRVDSFPYPELICDCWMCLVGDRYCMTLDLIQLCYDFYDHVDQCMIVMRIDRSQVNYL